MKRRRMLAGVLAATALAVGLVVAGTGAASADVVPPSPPQWAEIFNPHLTGSGITLCIDDPGGSWGNPQALQLWRCRGYASNGGPQRWVFSSNEVTGLFGTEMPVYYIYNAADNLCLGLPPNHTAGMSVVQETCSTNTLWVLRNVGPDFQLQWFGGVTAPLWCVASDTFLDVNGNRLLGEPCDQYNTSQLWNLG